LHGTHLRLWTLDGGAGELSELTAETGSPLVLYFMSTVGLEYSESTLSIGF